MNRFYVLLMVFIFAFTVPVYAAEVHELTFEWTYPETQNNIINGFRIYQQNKNDRKLIIEITNANMRFAKKAVVLSAEETEFYVVPFIGNREGDQTIIDAVKLTPFFPIGMFTVKCPTCGPQE